MQKLDIMYITIDSIGIIILLLMYFNFGSKDIKKKEIDDQIFSIMILINIGLLMTDMFMWLVDGKVFLGARIINLVLTAIYYILHPMMCLFWLLYCDYKLTGNFQKLKKRIPIFSISFGITVILTLLSCFTPFLFYIDEHNLYRRETFYPIFMFLCLIYFIYTYSITFHGMLIADKKSRQYKEMVCLLIYPIFPIIGAIIQSLFFGVAVIWVGSLISLLILYVNLQNSQITTDALTGINNRRRFESYIAYKLSNTRKTPILFMFMIDMDYFKRINDMFGHITGDQAIKQTADILIKSVEPKDFIARIGGDEFVVVGESEEEDDVWRVIHTIENNLSLLNSSKHQPYLISLSIGCAIVKSDENKTVDEFIYEADQKMYQQKQRHHAQLDFNE